MVNEQEAIERLRDVMEDEAVSASTRIFVGYNDLRALLAREKRLSEALEWIRAKEPMAYLAVEAAVAALEGSDDVED